MSKCDDAAYARERRERLIAEGLCYECGKVPPIPGRKRCENCVERSNQNRVYKMQHGICSWCGLACLPGKRLCAECRLKATEWGRAHKREYSKKYDKERRDKRKAAGLCPRCGKPAEKGRVNCAACTRKNVEARRQRKPPNYYWSSYGTCRLCGKPVVEGKQHCPEHLEMRRQLAANARQHIDYTKRDEWKRVDFAKRKAVQNESTTLVATDQEG